MIPPQEESLATTKRAASGHRQATGRMLQTGICRGKTMDRNNPLEIECTGVEANGKFSIEHTGRGKDSSPEFVIKNLSPSVQTLVITLEDLSHPINAFTHWIIWNIPASSTIPQAIPSGKFVSTLGGAVQGVGYGLHRYAGPKPPKGKSHKYCFTIYALDCTLDLKASSTKKKVLNRANSHIVQQGKIFSSFE